MVWADSLPFWKTTHFVVSYCIIINPHWRESNRRCCYRLRFSDFVGVLSIPFNIDVISLLSGLLGDLDLASGRHTSAWECYVSIDLRHTLYEKVTTDCQAKMSKQMSVGDTQTGASNPGFILKRYSVSNFWSRNVLKACHKDNIKTIRSLILHKNRKNANKHVQYRLQTSATTASSDRLNNCWTHTTESCFGQNDQQNLGTSRPPC